MPNGWRTINSLVHKIRLHGRRGKGTAESFSWEKLRQVPQKEGGWEILCDPGWYVHKPDVQNKWEDNTHTRKQRGEHKVLRAQVRIVQVERVCPLCRVWSEVFVISIIDPPWEDQCEWYRMTRMTGPVCAVMCNLINIHTHTLTPPSGIEWLGWPGRIARLLSAI